MLWNEKNAQMSLSGLPYFISRNCPADWQPDFKLPKDLRCPEDFFFTEI
jgi:hypothetical protein